MHSYIDTHCHLCDERLADQLSDVLTRAREAGVHRFVVNGTGVHDWEDVACLAKQAGDVLPAFGVHPWRLADQPDDWREQLRRRLDESGGIIGETGLDGLIDSSSREEQLDALHWHWQLSVERRLPIVLHCVKAFGPLLEALQAWGEHPAGLLLHGYAGSREMVKPFSELGARFSFGGPLTHNRHRLHDAAKAVPDDRLLLETDSPDQPPASRQDELNEPATLPEVAEVLADLRGTTAEAIAQLTTDNAKVFFWS